MRLSATNRLKIMADTNSDLLAPVARYYSDKLREFGTQPRGVDWNGPEGQLIRFAQLCKVIDTDAPFSIADIGCGYGALFEYLTASALSFDYIGMDIAESMVTAAAQAHAKADNARFLLGTMPSEPVDFAVASGIFNVKLGSDDASWETYIVDTLDRMCDVSRRGFAFNCLTSYSDADKMRPNLHYANPAALFDHCKRKYARNVALLHDYDLYEFTMIVRKSP